jgi:hypothetical protein
VAESKGISFCKRRRVNNCCRDKKNSLPAKNTENPWQSQREIRFANGEGLILVAEIKKNLFADVEQYSMTAGIYTVQAVK